MFFKRLQIKKGQSESVNRRRTDNYYYDKRNISVVICDTDTP
jgi:hypothetical protein